ncbi:Putative bifunctional phosphatase/peptidyl-prolyl cis-trans isomerase [Candidatus Izimaplasma bacterium HR1]|jgi:Cof subfamily protein (haloacid dehalogenase superfamily)|uniref:Cof-type HAD-IIB family hydrolase n=1 Tax=Candidatus Izimoplasma sp. HR1 TaxID=1541959 RepID=UPI0004F89331|nr:Putative bifunctional phosphatase/peptidyl-prolyl cis-trans isomerase [Candidatus Izimaplasma bacterium HR1]
MPKKYIFIDIDGTVLDHSTRTIPESTKLAIKKAKSNGHEVIINTGRPPCLFYGIDKEIGVTSFVAANGRYAVHNGEVILNKTIDREIITKVVKFAEDNRIDLGFEGLNAFKRQTSFGNLYQKFSNNFHLEVPELDPEFYLNNDIYQMTLYYDRDDYQRFEAHFPNLTFAYSCEYGIDVNSKGGLKEEGIEAFIKRYNIPKEDIIAIGDGHNDVSMFNFVHTSVAMGNAKDFVKEHATYVTDDVSNNGFYKAFEMLKLI